MPTTPLAQVNAPTISTDLAIEATELTRTYGKGEKAVPALDRLSLAVPAGVIFGLLGPNGAGKSTTVRILTTLSTADSGTATVAGFDVGREAGKVQRAIGYVSQKPGFDPAATGRENLVLQARVHGLPRREAARRAADLLSRFQLTDAADRLARTWSGGMQRKLDVALGLIHGPQVLFLDEPTTGLDPEARAEMWEEISRLRSDGLTVLLTTHYLEEADHLADHLAVIDRGTMVVEGRPDDLKAQVGHDTIVVDLTSEEDTGPARQALTEAIPTATRITAEGTTTRVTVPDGESALAAAVSAVARAGIELTSLTLARPSLDDVYARYAGRSFQAADDAGAKEAA